MGRREHGWYVVRPPCIKLWSCLLIYCTLTKLSASQSTQCRIEVILMQNDLVRLWGKSGHALIFGYSLEIFWRYCVKSRKPSAKVTGSLEPGTSWVRSDATRSILRFGPWDYVESNAKWPDGFRSGQAYRRIWDRSKTAIISGPEKQKGINIWDNTSLFLEFQALSDAHGC
jgi:hypothetical protein